jgi:hypothetical protein
MTEILNRSLTSAGQRNARTPDVVPEKTFFVIRGQRSADLNKAECRHLLPQARAETDRRRAMMGKYSEAMRKIIASIIRSLVHDPGLFGSRRAGSRVGDKFRPAGHVGLRREPV